MVNKVYIGLIQQGMVLDQKCVAMGADLNAVTEEAAAQAKKVNDAETGEAEGYSSVVLEFEAP